MPANIIVALSKKHKIPVAKLEKVWDDAVNQAEKQGKGDNYAYITSIFKSMIKGKFNIKEDQKMKESYKGFIVTESEDKVWRAEKHIVMPSKIGNFELVSAYDGKKEISHKQLADKAEYDAPLDYVTIDLENDIIHNEHFFGQHPNLRLKINWDKDSYDAIVAKIGMAFKGMIKMMEKMKEAVIKRLPKPKGWNMNFNSDGSVTWEKEVGDIMYIITAHDLTSMDFIKSPIVFEAVHDSGKSKKIKETTWKSLSDIEKLVKDFISVIKEEKETYKGYEVITEAKDNSHGQGFWEPTIYLSNYVGGDKPEFTYDVNQEIQKFTYKMNYKFGITIRDMQSLIRLGLMNMQSNEDGYLTLYFKKPAKQIK